MEDFWKGVGALAILAAGYLFFRWINRMINDAEKRRWKKQYTATIQKENADARDRRWRGGRR